MLVKSLKDNGKVLVDIIKWNGIAKKSGIEMGDYITELKIELGIPTEDFVSETGNKILIYKTSKYGIPCERKFEIDDQSKKVLSFSTSGCI